MAQRRDYRSVMRAHGRVKPLPKYEKLRTEKKAGDLELCSGGAVYLHRGDRT